MSFESVDVLVAMRPQARSHGRRRELLGSENLRVHANDEYLLVVGTVEDADAAALWQRLHRPPEVIVIEFFLRRTLERIDLGALRIQTAHHVLDGAVLSCEIHPLEDKQHGPAILSKEQLLKPHESLEAGLQFADGFPLVFERPRVVRGVSPQPDR